jgi:anti-sigma-K factor RskA
MSNPENPSHLEELAALHAVNQLDEAGEKELLQAAEHDPKLGALIRDYSEIAALLAYDATPIAPSPGLREKLLNQLPARSTKSRISSFSSFIPYAIAACLMALGIYETTQIKGLKSQLAASRTDAAHLRESNALTGLRLQTLAAKDGAYAAGQIIVAWDSYQHRGVVALANLPAPAAGHDYQLWVLDPGAEAPVNAGVISNSRSFAVPPVSTLCRLPGTERRAARAHRPNSFCCRTRALIR